MQEGLIQQQQKVAPLDIVIAICFGRLMFAEFAKNLFESLIRFGKPVAIGQSPYWEQSIQNVTEDALSYGAKYILYFDGDSIWSQDDLVAMYKVIDADPAMDAIQACQADRNSNRPLAFNWVSEVFKYDYAKPITQIVHGHFGFTLIRCSSFAKMPKPWFFSTPGKNGTWRLGDPGKLDPDTNFWIRFQQAGLRVFQANHTVAGHMDQHIRWQCGENIIVQTPMEYQRDGKPYGLRSPTPEQLGIKPGEAAFPAPALPEHLKIKESPAPGLSRAVSTGTCAGNGKAVPADQFPTAPEPVMVGEPTIVDPARGFA